MIDTIQHQASGKTVVAAKLLTGYLRVKSKVKNPEAFLRDHQLFDAGFVAYILPWQSDHKLTPDGIIGPDTWAAIAKAAPTCSTSKNRISGPTLALQILLNTNIDTDGIYGPRTKAAVVVYQTSKKLAADGICGPKTWGALLATSEAPAGNAVASGGVTPAKGTFKQCVDYKQYDSRWANKMYSSHGNPNQTMKNSACGPTAMADIVATLKDPSINPYDLAQLAVKWGDRSYDKGTNWTFFLPHIMDHFGFAKAVQSASIDALKACLDAGGYVVCSMGPGYWTTGGHFITAWKYDATHIYCCDPASSTRKKQTIAQFMQERKQFFCFYPDRTAAPAKADGAAASPTAKGYRGQKIVDISKWQPTVDYDALLSDTALVILRAGYRGTGGSVKTDEKFKAHAAALRERGVRFGVYFYSIADTKAKAIEEARAFVKCATEYNPLFYAMDAEYATITTEAIGAFADELRALGCLRIGAYVANDKYKTPYNFASVRDKFDFVWIPKYSTAAPSYKCDLWQYTSTGSVAGISGSVDMSRITGDGRSLAWFLGGE